MTDQKLRYAGEPDCVRCGDESARIDGVGYCIDGDPVCPPCYLLECSQYEWNEATG